MVFCPKTLRSIVVIGILDLFVVSLWLFVRSNGVGKVINKRRGILSVLGYGSVDDTCPVKRQIAFVKVPNAGSATVQKILYRFGTTREQTFALPRYGEDTGFDGMDQKRGIISLPPFRETFDIACNHAKYNKEEFLDILPSSSSYIGIVSHPLSLLNDYLYSFREKVVQGEDKLSKYLLDPDAYVDTGRSNMSNNLLSSYFDLQYEYMKNTTEIETFVKHIDEEFEMILVSELLDESLVVMKRQLCWNMSDILYLVASESPRKKSNLQDINVIARNNHRKMAQADYIFYRHFHKKMEDRIFQEGKDFQQELYFYKHTLRSINSFCQDQLWKTKGPLMIRESPWGESFNVSGGDCEMMMKTDLELLDLVGGRQYGPQWKTLHHNHSLHNQLPME